MKLIRILSLSHYSLIDRLMNLHLASSAIPLIFPIFTEDGPTRSDRRVEKTKQVSYECLYAKKFGISKDDPNLKQNRLLSIL